MRTYEKTNPWIKFQLDLGAASPRLWMLLGEASSLCKHITGIPLRPDIAKSLQQAYLAKGAHASAALAGNTLSEQDALLRITGKLRLPQSREYLGRELDNIAGALKRIGDFLRNGDDALTPERVEKFNGWILEELVAEGGIDAGDARRGSDAAGPAARGVPEEDREFLLDRLCAWLSGPDFHPPEGMEIAYAIVKAVVAHLYIVWIRPFGDGNGRTARLSEFQILLSAGVPAPAAGLMSNHYNETQIEYHRQLEAASGADGAIVPFLEYAAQGLVDELRELLTAIRSRQWDVAWEDFIHEEFRERAGKTARRQLSLALALSRLGGPIQSAMVPDLSPRLARAYAGLTSKTIQRDLAALVKMDLAERTEDGFRAKREKILAFLPGEKRRREGVFHHLGQFLPGIGDS